MATLAFPIALRSLIDGGLTGPASDKGAQAMAAKILDRSASVAKAKRMPARDLAPIVQDLVSLLERSVGSLTNGKYPDGDASKIAAALRKVADNFDA